MLKGKHGTTLRCVRAAGKPRYRLIVSLVVFCCWAPTRPCYAELIWSSFVGGSDYDYAIGVAADSQGNTIVAGDTRSNVFYGATTPAFADAFVACLDAEGGLRWVTCIGGRGVDSALNLAVDAADNIFITGLTASDDMPARTNSYHLGTDAFVARLDPDGRLLWTTYLGGSGLDQGFDVALDAAGNALVAGHTESRDFQHRRNSYWGGSFDGFAALVAPDGAVQWVSYIGWLGSDYCAAAAVDPAGNLLVAGTSSSAALPQAVNTSFGADDAFIAVFAPDGALQRSRFLGGARADRGCDIAVSRWGHILLAGDTESTDFAGAQNAAHGAKDAFVSILDNVEAPVRTTLFGGEGVDGAWAVAEDAVGNIVLSGSTWSRALAGSDNVYDNGQEAFVAAFSATGTALFSSYLGGGGDDCAFGIAVDGDNHVLIAGSTGSTDFAGARDYNGGSRDGFVIKLAGASGAAPDLVIAHTLTNMSAIAGARASVPVQVENAGAVDVVAYGSGFFRTALYLAGAADADWDNLAAEDIVAWFDLPGLAAADIHITTLDIDVPAEPGTYYLRARTDDQDSVRETREQNNWGQVITLTLSEPAGLPDLVIGQPVQQAISVVRGCTVSVDVQIANIGQSNAAPSGVPAFITRLYLADAPDADWSSTAAILAPIERTGLPAGASYATDFRLTASMNEGVYYLRARADDTNAVTEADEENNWGPLITLTVLQAAALPDLTIAGEDNMIIRSTPGHRVEFVADVANISDANAVSAGSTPIRAAVYLASHAGANWSTLPEQDRVAAADVPSIAAGQTLPVTFAFDAPAQEGAYCLRAKVDTANALQEVSEQNNWGPVVAFLVETAGLPDIVASFPEANDISARPLEIVDVAVDVANVGPVAADPAPAALFETLLYLAADGPAAGEPNSVALLQTGLLDPYETQTGIVSFVAPARQGTYYLQARADVSDNVRESNEYNNLTPRLTLVVGGASSQNEPPRLTDIGPLTVAEGQTLTFTLEAVDPENDPLDFRVLNCPRGATLTAAVFTWTPDYDQAGAYEGVLFCVSDGSSSDCRAVDILVTDTNRPPTIALPAITVNENQPVAFTVGAGDPDGDTLLITADNLPAGATLSGGQFAWTPTFDQAGVYVIRFVVADGHPQDGETSGTVIITVMDVNRPPVANAGPDRVVTDMDGDGREAVFLDGAATLDPDGDTLTYCWTNAAGDVLAAEPAPLLSLATGVHILTLTVADSHGSSHSDSVRIEVQGLNSPPLARAGDDLTLVDSDADGLGTVTLDGSASTDADGAIVNWHWFLYDTLVASGAVRQLVLPLGTFEITLKVTDDSGASASDTLTVAVVPPPPNTPPVLRPLADQTVRQNQKLTFTVTADDTEGDPVTLTASNLPANATFHDGVFTFRPWYDQGGLYTVTFTASDGRAQNSRQVAITVQSVVLTKWYSRWLEKGQAQ